MAPARIALPAAAFAAALFLPVGDGVAAESGRAPPPPVYVTCPNGECPPVVLCEPGSVWDARARACRQVSFCPGDRKVQIPGGPCELYCRPGTEVHPRDPNRCRTAPSLQVCARAGRVYDSAAHECVANSGICATIGKLYEFSANRCVADDASCEAVGFVYIRNEDRCAVGEQICRDAGKVFDDDEYRCVVLTDEYCRRTGRFLDNNQCAANEDICAKNGLVYNLGAKRCVAINADSCGAAGRPYDSAANQCGEICMEGTELAGGACLNICRNNDHNGRVYYEPQAYPRISAFSGGIPSKTVRDYAGCVCPPGQGGDKCRELDRTHGSTTVKLPFAHSLTLANGEFLLGQGVSVGVVEVGPLRWRDSDGAVRAHSDLPSVRAFCFDENMREGECVNKKEIGEVFHGLAVLGVMAAKKDGRGLAGVAPKSDYLYAHYNYNSILVYEDLVTNGASIINNSWTPEYYIATHDFRPRGACGTAEECMEQARDNLQAYARRSEVGLGTRNLPTHDGRRITLEVNEWFTTYHYKDSIVDGVAPADRPIYVWSAGNNNGRTVTANITVRAADNSVLTVLRKGSVVTATSLASVAGLPYYFPDMTLNNLAVAAVDEFYRAPVMTIVDGETLYQSPIARFSNPCGKGASSFCLAAPGVASYEFGREEYVEIALTLSSCDLGLYQYFGGGDTFYQCEDDVAHQEVLKHLVAEKLRTGLGSGFVLAPETEEFIQQERRLPAGYDETQGTSFSAPMVSGALALMKSYFMLGTDCGAGGECGLGSHELVGRILATADRRGIYADASIYGSGLLDLQNALTPQGELRLLLGRSVKDSSSHLLSQSGLRPGAALGDSALRALSGVRLAAFDALNAPFPVFGDAVLSADDSAEEAGGGAGVEGGGVGEALRAHQSGFRGRRRPPASDWDFEDGYGFLTLRGGDFLSSWGAGEGEGAGGSVGGSMGGSVGGSLGAVGFGNPYSALVGDGMVAGVVGDGFRLAAFGEGLGSSRRIRGAFAEFSLASFSFLPEGAEGAGLSFQVGGMEELDGLLDTSGAGVFGRLRARTAFAGLGFSGELPGGWRVRAGGFAGRTAAEDGSGWLSPVEDLWSGAYALGLERDNVLFSGDALGFRVHQPLRASGGLRLRVPTGRTRYGDLTWREVSGAPSGRELIWEGLYRRSSDEGDWLLSAGVISQPGHRADAKALGRMLLAFERAF